MLFPQGETAVVFTDWEPSAKNLPGLLCNDQNGRQRKSVHRYIRHHLCMVYSVMVSYSQTESFPSRKINQCKIKGPGN